MSAEEVKVGSFQVVLLFFLAVNYIIVSMNHALPDFHSYTPNFYCKMKGSVNSTNACVTPMEIPTTNATSLFENGVEYSSCETGYRFDSVRGETTIVTEWELICERRYLLPLSTTLYFCGVVIGAWIAGVLADRVGRLPVLAMCLYTQGTLAVALYIIQDYRAFLVVRALQGVFVQGLQISTYTLLLELFPVRTRTLVGMSLQFAWALGLALLAGLSYTVADWRVLQLATSVPTAVTVLYIWIIPESPRWLLAKGKLTEAHMALENIAKYNTCWRRRRVETKPEVEEANATTTTATENLTPVKPKRKSRMANADLNETQASDVLPEEIASLLTSPESSEVKMIQASSENELLTPSESMEQRISNLELQLKLDNMSRSKPEDRRQESPLPSPPPSPYKDSRSSIGSEGNQEVPPDVPEELVELRITEIAPEKKEEIPELELSIDKKDEDVERKSGVPENQNFLQLLRHPRLRRSFVVLMFLWFSVFLAYFGFIFHLPNLTGNRHVNFAIGAFLDLVTYTLTYLVLRKFGRRIPLSIYLLLSGTICVVTAAISMPIHEDASWSGPTKWTMVLLGKEITVSSIAIISLYTVESFPTVLRGTSLGYCEISGKIGSLIAPQLVTWGAKASVVLPMSIMGTLCFLSGILSLVLSETLNKPLPDTIDKSKDLYKRNGSRCELGEELPVRKINNKRHTASDEQTERDILREKLFSEENGGKTWVDAGNGIIVNFSDGKNVEQKLD